MSKLSFIEVTVGDEKAGERVYPVFVNLSSVLDISKTGGGRACICFQHRSRKDCLITITNESYEEVVEKIRGLN